MTKQLCRGNYRASHIPGTILVVATGWHPTAGYKVWFEPDRAPFHVALYHEAPQVGADVLTAFTVATTIADPTNAIQVIWVRDAAGVHAVKVEPVFDVAGCGGASAQDGGAPFPLQIQDIDRPFPFRAAGGDGPFPKHEKLAEERRAIKPGHCGGWYAWIDKMPGAPEKLFVIGTCVFPTTGWTVELRRASPQGINPKILLLDKIVTPPTGIVLEVITTVHVRYEEFPPTGYEQVTIIPGPTIPVHIIQ